MSPNAERTKARLEEARLLAEDIMGHDGKNPVIIAAVLQSLAIDDLSQTLTDQVQKLSDDMCRAADVVAGYRV
jgi:hypothetical protein